MARIIHTGGDGQVLGLCERNDTAKRRNSKKTSLLGSLDVPVEEKNTFSSIFNPTRSPKKNIG